MNHRTLILVLFSLGAPCVAPAQILNGSFETPAVSTLSVLGLGVAPGITVFTNGTQGITDWTIVSGDVSIVNANAALTASLGLFTANSGNQFALLNGVAETVSVFPLGINLAQTGTIGELSQTFNTVAGKSYQVSFAYRGLALGVLTNNPVIDIGLTNATSSTAPGSGVLTADISLNAWQSDTFTFVATGTSSTLSFYQDSSGVNVGLLGLDNVQLTALPEPSQYGAAAVAFLALLVAGRIWTQLRAQPVPISA